MSYLTLTQTTDNEYKVGDLIAAYRRASVWEYIWSLVLFKPIPSDDIFEVIAVDKGKLHLKFLYRI